MDTTEKSVAEALTRAHAVLLDDLTKLEEVAGSAPEEALADLRLRLGATHRHVAEHFRFEEQNGYLDVVRKRDPRLDRAILQLAEEHRDLRRSLDALILEVGAAARLDDSLRGKVQEWVRSIREHETRENDLVQDAFNLDIAAED
jgi:hypothetical protein